MHKMDSDYQRNKKEEVVKLNLNRDVNHLKENDCSSEEEADFETAISETGFGKFNVILMLITIPPSFSQIFETASMSYVMPIAQCDLHLTTEDKGLLNGVTFAGMITSSLFWGYLCDTLGRRRIIVTGYYLVGFFVLLASLSRNITILIVAKFFGGFIINGPFSATTTYLSEFHASKYRARVQMVRGSVVSLACIALPLLAWAILPRNVDFLLLGYINLHSWNIFIFICSLLPFTCATVFIFMPESPKFLMAIGKNEEALQVFQRVYAINTGNSMDSYPIKKLIEETKLQGKSENVKADRSDNVIKNWMAQMKPIFLPPYILKLLLACSNMFLILMSLNTLNLWLPQLFQEINDYQFNHNGTSSNICEMFENIRSNNISSTCNVNLENTSVYTNAIVVGTIRFLGFGIAGLFVNLLGKKHLLIITALISASFASSLYFARNSITVLALASLHLSSAGVCQNISVTITLEMFPTTLRNIALSMHMTSGRLATVIGNIIFPSFLYAGCLPPFLYLGLLMFGCAILSSLYPDTENKPLE